MADITGTANADFLLGTPDDDIIDALGGNDVVFAGPGDLGNDIVAGGDGDDEIGAGPGNDLILGDNHDGDLDLGAPGDDGANTLYGGDGDDLLFAGGYSNDGTNASYAGAAGGALASFVTGTGASTAWAGAGADIVYGGDGDDILGGGAGADEVYGGAGNDLIYAGAGDDDEMFGGGEGNDTIFNGGGNDVVDGGAGDDELWGGGGDDEITSGAGSDVLGFIAGNGNDTVTDFTLGEDIMDLQAFSADFADAAAVVAAMVDVAGGVQLTLASDQVVTFEGLSVFDFSTSTEDFVNLTGVPEGLSGDTLILTKLVDFIEITDPSSFDLIKGVVDGDGDANTDDATFSVADTIIGNGNTALELAVVEDGSSAFTTLMNIDRIDIVAATTTSITFEASDWTDVGSVNLLRGANGLDVVVDNAISDIGASVSDQVEGSVEINGTGGEYVYVDADEDSSGSYADWNVTANVASSESVEVTVSNTDDGDVTVGMVSAILGDSATFDLAIESDEGAVTVGDIMTSAGVSSSVDIFISADGSEDAVVGNVNMMGGDDLELSVSQHEVGDVTVGHVVMSGSDDMDFYIYNHIDNGTAEGAVNTTVGNIMMTATGVSSSDISIEVTNENQGGVGGDVLIGDITVSALGLLGDISIEVTHEGNDVTGGGDSATGMTTVGMVNYEIGTSGDFTYDVSVEADGSGDATIGDVTLGALTGTQGVNSFGSYDITVDASGTGLNTIGNITVGDITVAVDDGATFSFEISADASGSGGSIGGVSIGNIMTTAGVSGDIDIYGYLEVNTNGSIGPVSIGNVMMDIGENGDGELTFEVDANTSGFIGGFTVGDLTVIAGTSASITEFSFSATAETFDGPLSLGNINVSVGEFANVTDFNFDIYATDGNYGAFSVGNIVVDVAANGSFTGDITVSGDYGVDMGAATIGDVSMTAATSADASYDISLYEMNDLESLTVGAVSLVATGDNADVDFSLTIDASQDVGAFTVGDVSLTANGLDALAEFYVSADYMDENDGIFIGDVTLSVDSELFDNGGGVTIETAEVEFTAYNYEGSVTVGDINLSTASTGTTANDSFVSADMNLTAEDEDGDGNIGDINIGNVNVSGGDGIIDNFATLTSWLSLDAEDDINIGSINYSGYGADATIDVTTFTAGGDVNIGSVVGSGNDDTITDGANVTDYTGGAGADTFVFSTADNTGLTETDIDSVSDFTNGDGDELDVGVAGTVGEYSEGTYADFSTFLAAADAGDKDVFVGAVGANVFVAADWDGDDVVDFVIELSDITLAGVDVGDFV